MTRRLDRRVEARLAADGFQDRIVTTRRLPWIDWPWRQVRLYLKGTRCLDRCSSGHTYGRWCLLRGQRDPYRGPWPKEAVDALRRRFETETTGPAVVMADWAPLVLTTETDEEYLMRNDARPGGRLGDVRHDAESVDDEMRDTLTVYVDTSNRWVGYYRGPNHHYVCPLPCIVIRWPRRSGAWQEVPVAPAGMPKPGTWGLPPKAEKVYDFGPESRTTSAQHPLTGPVVREARLDGYGCQIPHAHDVHRIEWGHLIYGAYWCDGSALDA